MGIDIDRLKKMATDQSFQRGVAIYENDMVVEPVLDGDKLMAKVEGSSLNHYDVQINLKTATSYCTCPYDWGGICKHVVALGLYWCNKGETIPDITELKAEIRSEFEEVFKALEKEDLIDFISEIISKNINIKLELVDYLERKGKVSDSIILTRLGILKEKALNIVDQFNTYGGGPRADEDECYDYLNEIVDILEQNNIPRGLRTEIINDFMEEYLRKNSIFEDLLRSIIYAAAEDSRDWKLIVRGLEKSDSFYDKEEIKKICLHEQINE
jgi:hypothetical protein